MGMRNSKNIEEYSTDNMEFDSTLNQKLNLDEKDSLIFVTNKNTESNENKSINININLTEELNKSTKVDSTFDNNTELVPFKFEWKEEDNNPNREIEVMLTGTFLNNWDSYVKMEKNPDTNIYEYEILLPKAKHFFKYIINNKWKCSNLYPTEKDNSNNTNNYIDLTNYNKNNNIIKNIFDGDSYSENNNENKIKTEKIKKRKKIINKKNNDLYGQKFPLINDLNLKAPTVMIHNKDPFSLENQSNQKELGNLSFYSTKEKDYSTANTSYKPIFIFPHEKLSHIVPNIDDILSTKKYNRYSITQRKKHKYLTIVYYKPK
jgi:hypothetical protein